MEKKINSYDEIATLIGRQRKIGNVFVDIFDSGVGGRYRAFITTTDCNFMIETPLTIEPEGIVTFYERILPDVYAAYKESLI